MVFYSDFLLLGPNPHGCPQHCYFGQFPSSSASFHHPSLEAWVAPSPVIIPWHPSGSIECFPSCLHDEVDEVQVIGCGGDTFTDKFSALRKPVELVMTLRPNWTSVRRGEPLKGDLFPPYSFYLHATLFIKAQASYWLKDLVSLHNLKWPTSNPSKRQFM